MLGVVPGGPALGVGMDWIAHSIQYALLMVWFGGIVAPSRHLYVALGLILLGLSIELVQATNIFRYFDLRDLAANAGGVLVGLLMVRTALRDWCRRVEARLGGPRV